MPESAVAIAERALVIEGVASPSALQRVDERGDFTADPPAIALFVSFAYADLPMGWSFTHVWKADDPAVVQEVEGNVEACTQQFGKPLDDVPHGWKSIILFRFRGHIPAMVEELPVLDSWNYRPVLHFGSEGAWRAASSIAPDGRARQVDLHSIAEGVADESSFLNFIQLLGADRAVEAAAEAIAPVEPWGPGTNGWENGSIEAFLSAAAAWGAASANGLPIYTPPENPWRRCAEILLMGKHYE